MKSYEFLKSIFPEHTGDAPSQFSTVVCDSREVQSNSLFIARRGESADGHQFIDSAYSQGARFFFVERDYFSALDTDLYKGAVFFAVEDSTEALGMLAQAWRAQLGIPVILVTGSNGKTTTKEILASILKQCIGDGIASKRSYNNHVGLPQTVLEADSSHKWLLLEAGMNHAGELDKLAKIAKPDYSAVLNIAAAHLGNFASIEEIADAKCEVLAHTSKAAVLNLDDQRLLAAVGRSKNPDIHPLYFGASKEASFRISGIKADGLNGMTFSLHHRETEYQIKLPHIGAHNAYNAAAALALFHLAFPDVPLDKPCSALADAGQAPMRLQVEQLGEYTVLNDCYNANPSSMEAALRTASEISKGRGFTAILGDMLELGAHSESEHRRIGALAVELGAKELISVGNFANLMAEAAKSAGLQEVSSVKKASEAGKAIFAGSLSKVVLIKASRGVSLETVFAEIVESLGNS